MNLEYIQTRPVEISWCIFEFTMKHKVTYILMSVQKAGQSKNTFCQYEQEMVIAIEVYWLEFPGFVSIVSL